MQPSDHQKMFVVEGCKTNYYHILKIARQYQVRSAKILDHNEFKKLVETYDNDHIIWWLQYDHYIFTYLSLDKYIQLLSRRKNQVIMIAHTDSSIRIPKECIFIKRDLEMIKQELPKYFTEHCTLLPPPEGGI